MNSASDGLSTYLGMLSVHEGEEPRRRTPICAVAPQQNEGMAAGLGLGRRRREDVAREKHMRGCHEKGNMTVAR